MKKFQHFDFVQNHKMNHKHSFKYPKAWVWFKKKKVKLSDIFPLLNFDIKLTEY